MLAILREILKLFVSTEYFRSNIPLIVKNFKVASFNL